MRTFCNLCGRKVIEGACPSPCPGDNVHCGPLQSALFDYVYAPPYGGNLDSTEKALVIALQKAGKLDADEVPVSIWLHTDDDIMTVNVERSNGDVDSYDGRF